MSNPGHGQTGSGAGGRALTVYCPGAVQSLVRPLLNEYAAASGNTIRFESFTVGAIVERITGGAPADVVVALAGGISTLAKAGKIAIASIRPLGTIGLGVAVRRSTPVPVIDSVETFKQAMLAAGSITYSDPASGGQSGIQTAKAMERIGIAEAIAPRLHLRHRGTEGFEDVAQGITEIGLGPVSEILANKGLVLAAPYPPEIQSSISYAVGVHARAAHPDAAEDLVAALTSPTARARFQAAGFVFD